MGTRRGLHAGVDARGEEAGRLDQEQRRPTGWADERNPVWTTVEAGQGGPSTGYDFMKRKGPRQMNPVDSRQPKKELMGWLDLDAFFGDK